MARRKERTNGNGRQRVRYAVVGLGHIAQAAVLPAFKHAGKNSILAALVSGDATKRRALCKRYKVDTAVDYDGFAGLLQSGEVDAVYIALPNHLHRQYTEEAARHGIHVLCEKPMAPTEKDCELMIDACREHDVRLMIAYRLHFERGNMKAVQLLENRRIGTPRYFTSEFSMRVKPGDIRLNPTALGGGPVYDIGVYCVNAARYLFQREPVEVFAVTATGSDPRFRETHEALSAVLRFPEERLATFTCSFGASDVSAYRVVGTKGDLLMEPAYEYAEGLTRRLTVNGKTSSKTYPKRDQFAPELLRFSEAILTRTDPQPSGHEGLADIRIVEALLRSAKDGVAFRLEPFLQPERPSLGQELHKPPIRKPKLVHASSASED